MTDATGTPRGALMSRIFQAHDDELGYVLTVSDTVTDSLSFTVTSPAGGRGIRLERADVEQLVDVMGRWLTNWDTRP